MREFRASYPLNVLNTAYSLINEGVIIELYKGRILQGELNNYSLTEVIGEYPSISSINVHEMVPKISKYPREGNLLVARKEKDLYVFSIFTYETK